MKKLRLAYLFVAFGLFSLLPDSAASSDREYGVVSHNIRYDGGRDDPSDLDWRYRMGRVAVELMRYSPDIICLQEVLHNQLTDFVRIDGEGHGFFSPLGYGVVGEGRDGGTRGEYNPILYRKSRLRVLASGTVWLAPGMPTRRTKAWGAPLRRIVTYAKFQDRQTWQRFWVFNTHFSHRHDDNARDRRMKQAKELHHFISHKARRYRVWNADFYDGSQKIANRDVAIPFMARIIVTGDFNTTNNSVEGGSDKPYGIMTKPLVDEMGGRPESFWLSFLTGATPFNASFYATPRRIRELSSYWRIAVAHSTLTRSRPTPAEITRDGLNMRLNAIDWLLANEGFRRLEFHETDRDVNSWGNPHQGADGREIRLSDAHDMLYAKFRMQWDTSGNRTHAPVNVVVPRFFGKSYAPISRTMDPEDFYHFDRIELRRLID